MSNVLFQKTSIILPCFHSYSSLNFSISETDRAGRDTEGYGDMCVIYVYAINSFSVSPCSVCFNDRNVTAWALDVTG